MAWVTETSLRQNSLLLAHLLTMSLIDRETERNFSKMVKFLLININLESAGTAAAGCLPCRVHLSIDIFVPIKYIFAVDNQQLFTELQHLPINYQAPGTLCDHD